MNFRAIILAFLSAALFGVSTPAAKVLLGSVDPVILAGLFYCGAGFGVGIVRRLARPLIAPEGRSQTPLARSDLPPLAAAILAGGVAGPILLMTGLAHTGAAAASLLLTLEGVATALLAWFVFHENFDRKIAAGMACLAAGAALLAWNGHPTLSNVFGPFAILAACFAWGQQLHPKNVACRPSANRRVERRDRRSR